MKSAALVSMHTSPLAAPGLSDAGGMNLYIRRLADDLARAGLQVDVFTRRADTRTPPIALTSSGVRVVHLQAGPLRPLPKSVLPMHVPAFSEELLQFARRNRARYDVIHSHYWLSGLAALEVRPVLEIPHVHMFHTLSRVKEFYCGLPDPADTIHRFDGERRIIHQADAIVGATVEEEVLMDRLYGRRPNSFAVIPPGVDLATFRPLDKDVARRSLGIDADRVIVFVGRMDRIKGLDTLLRSMAELSNTLPYRLRLLVAGGAQRGNGAGLSHYRDLAGLLGIGDNVTFLGSIPPGKLPTYYAAADVCAVPSAYESFGMAAAEAMACGRPVVGFGVGGLAHTVRDGQTGFLAAPGNSQDFTEKLTAALTSTELDSMGRQARISMQRFSWDMVAQRTLELYQQTERATVCCSGSASGQQ